MVSSMFYSNQLKLLKTFLGSAVYKETPHKEVFCKNYFESQAAPLCSTTLLSCPQAARMSCPRGVLIGEA